MPRRQERSLELRCVRGAHFWIRPVGPGGHPKSCPEHPRDSNAGPVTKSCESCGEQFTCATNRATSARFCSMKCRDSGRRRIINCQHCQAPISVKLSEAERTLFCSRLCLFAARSCSRCSKMVPVARREAGHSTCSERCKLGVQLDGLAAGGQLHSWCPVCASVLPADAFHREAGTRNGLSVQCKECTLSKYQDNKIAYRRRRFLLQSPNADRIQPFTQEQQDARWSMWGGCCWMCGIAGATEEDHVKPLSAGGSHTLSNLRPICKSCNASKRASWPLSPAALRANFRHPNPRSGLDARTPRLIGRVVHRCERCGRTQLLAPSVAAQRRYCSRECKNANTVPPLDRRRVAGVGQATLF